MDCKPGSACFVNAAVQWAHGQEAAQLAHTLALLRAFLLWRGFGGW